jgi:hypothetical protein
MPPLFLFPGHITKVYFLDVLRRTPRSGFAKVKLDSNPQKRYGGTG